MRDILLIGLMALVTYATRVAGLLAAGFIAEDGRSARWLERLGTAVLAIILAVGLVGADPLAIAGTAVAAAAMLISGRFFSSMWLGVITTATLRLLAGWLRHCLISAVRHEFALSWHPSCLSPPSVPPRRLRS